MNINDLPDRIADKIMPTDDGCWLWTGYVLNTGYGQVHYEGSKHLAHRLVFQHLVGPITEETLDHLCRVRSCVNPEHLEPVSSGENVLRGEGVTARLARQTHCKRGHPFSDDNTHISTIGSRVCRTCHRAHWHRWNQQRKEASHADT